jgi:hypothetical protein
MELILGAVLATIAELVLVAFLLAPRWMSRRLKQLWRRLLYGARAAAEPRT